jgi:hypothetical protein
MDASYATASISSGYCLGFQGLGQYGFEQVMYLLKVFEKRLIFSILFVSILSTVSSGVIAKEPDPVKLIKEMSKEISRLDSFILQSETYMDARLDAGQLIENSMQVTMRVVRPGSFRISNKNLETTKEIYFEDHLMTIFDSSTGFYGQKEIPSEEKNPLIYAVENLGIDAPLLDILDANLTKELLKQADEVQYFGESLIRGSTYHQIGLRLAEVDMQLWIGTETPLPGKLVISAKWEGGAPRTVSFIDWQINPAISKADLKFDAPKGAIKIEIQTNP